MMSNDSVLGKKQTHHSPQFSISDIALMDFLTSHYAHLVARDTQNRGYISEDLNIVILTLSFFLYGMRMYSRLLISKSPGLDDAIITIGMVSGFQDVSQNNTSLNHPDICYNTLRLGDQM
jgi:hypothetical protein